MSSTVKVVQKALKTLAICMVLMVFLTVKASAQGTAPPMITASPVGITVSLLGTGVFTAKSKRGSSYQWLLNGQPFNGGVALNLPDLNLLSGQTDSTLTVVVNTNIQGAFALKVTNLGGSVTSAPAMLVLSGVNNLLSNVVNIVSTGTGKVLGGFQIQVAAPTGSNVVFQATSDMSHWTSLSTNTATSGSATYVDTAAPNMPCRFYRVRLQ